jgi:cyanophycin synthetase
MSSEGVIVPGYLLGFRYPVVVFGLKDSTPDPDGLATLSSALTTCLGLNLQQTINPQTPVPKLLEAIANQTLASLNCGIMEPSRLLKTTQDQQQLFIPCHLIIAQPIRYFFGLCLRTLESTNQQDQQKHSLTLLISEALKLLRKPFLASNTALFIKAAYNLRAAHCPREQDFIDYGLGKFRKRLQSSLTEQTSAIATQLAQDKKLTGDLLREALLPGSELRVIANEEQAVRVALQLGFPVVLKPQSLDKGIGVYPNLQNIEEVRSAYQSLHQLTNQIVMERHFEGRDYRLVIYKNKVLWAIEREYPGVYANGIDSIRALIETENQNPLRGESPEKVLVPLQLDPEAHACLRRQGLSADSIPEPGRFIKLREKSNINSGGQPITFPRQDIHPDNIQLVKDVANCVGLDLAGIDVLTSHLGVSWKESGALVCDVNAQPTLGALTSKHLYEEILRSELEDGFSPQIVIVACPVDKRRLLQLSRTLSISRKGLGLIVHGYASLDDEEINIKSLSTFCAARGLLQRKALESLVVATNGELWQTGLPHFEVNAMVIPRDYLELADGDKKTIKRMLAVTLPHCRHLVISNSVYRKEQFLIEGIRRNFPQLLVKLDSRC